MARSPITICECTQCSQIPSDVMISQCRRKRYTDVSSSTAHIPDKQINSLRLAQVYALIDLWETMEMYGSEKVRPSLKCV